MSYNENWVSGDFGDLIKVDTKRTDLAGKTLGLFFYDPAGTRVPSSGTYSASEGDTGVVEYAPTEANVTGDSLLVATGEWGVYVSITATGFKRRSAYGGRINVVAEGN